MLPHVGGGFADGDIGLGGGNSWDQCSKVSMTTRHSSVRNSGNGDRCRINLNGSLNKRYGSFDFH